MPSPEVSRVQRATAPERPRCLAALVTAFVDGPLLRWMLPDPVTYLEFFPQVLWLPPGVGPDERSWAG